MSFWFKALFTSIKPTVGKISLALLWVQQEKHVPPSVQGHIPTQVSRCEPSGWNRDVSSQPWSLKPVVYWCCQSPCSDRYYLPSDGPSTRRLQIEVRICRGLWHSSRYELPERLQSFVTSSFKVHLQVDLWWSMESLWVTSGRVMKKCANIWTSRLKEIDCVTTSQLSEQHPFPAVSHSPLRYPLWLHVVSVVSNKEEILVPSWPAHRGHREIYGVCLLHSGCFWTEPDINNTSPVHQSSIGSSFMLWSSDFIECKMWLHGVVFHMRKWKQKCLKP